MKRRDFILMGAVGLAAVGVPVYYYNREIKYDTIIAQPKSLSMIWDAQTINATGKQYSKQTPGEQTERSLAKLLVEENDIEQRIKKDFQNGNTVMVDGWILSVTEARQCALSSAIQTK